MIKGASSVRVRIAPSPTGILHVGTAHTALFNYLFAQQHKGKLLLRIEDTDRERSKKEFEDDIVEGLQWLGITWDKKIEHQSKRFDIYTKYLTKLIGTGNAFYCPHTEQELEKEKNIQMQNKMFPHHICNARDADLKEGIIRFKNQRTSPVVFQDLIRGNVSFDPQLIGDFSIARGLRSALYHFAVIVDDFEQNISHIIRGEDHISNTPKHILIQEALSMPRPIYAHLPLLLGIDRSKLSKRHGVTGVSEYRRTGYLSDALLNFLVLLGWNPGTDQEIFSLDELIREFSLAKVQKAGAIFDVAKLDWMNGEYIRKKSLQELCLLAKPYITEFSQATDQYIEQILALEQPRLKKFSELPKKIDYFFQEPKYNPSLLIWKSMNNESLKNSLAHAQKIVEEISGKNWNKEHIATLLLKEAKNYKNKGELLWPLRVALSGKKASPSPFDILYILGKESSIKRIQKAIAML